MAMVLVCRGGRARRLALCPRAALSRARALRCLAPARCCYTGLKLAFASGRGEVCNSSSSTALRTQQYFRFSAVRATTQGDGGDREPQALLVSYRR